MGRIKSDAHAGESSFCFEKLRDIYRLDVEPLGSQKVGSLMKSGVHANRAIDPQDICCHRFVGRHRNEPVFRKFGCIEVPWINEHSVIVERSTDTFKVQNSFHRNRDHFVSVGLECLS